MLISELGKFGAIGLLAAAGWGLAIWLLYRDHKKRQDWKAIVEVKDKLIADKDIEADKAKEKIAEIISELSNQRIADLKEITTAYNEVANSQIQTLDKLTVALNVSSHIIHK